jgi:hypothetical protein
MEPTDQLDAPNRRLPAGHVSGFTRKNATSVYDGQVEATPQIAYIDQREGRVWLRSVVEEDLGFPEPAGIWERVGEVTPYWDQCASLAGRDDAEVIIVARAKMHAPACLKAIAR